MKCLVVLSHLMSKECKLSVESVARSQLAIKHFSKDAYEFLITIGWAYRADCANPISEVIKNFILTNSEIEQKSIVSLTSSRDTVGDAYYCLEYLHNAPMDEIHIVTSDYHKERAEHIFTKIFNNQLRVKVYGAMTEANTYYSILLHEKQSIDAFNNTFAMTDFSSIKSIYKSLRTKHPFYNGDAYPQI